MAKLKLELAGPNARRVAKLRESLTRGHDKRRAKIDALLITNPTSIGYLSGFTGSLAMIVVTPRESLFITDGRYVAQAAEQCPGFELIQAHGSGGYIEALSKTFEKRPKIHRLGFEGDHVHVNRLRALRKGSPKWLKWSPAPDFVEQQRAIKDELEIAAIREAIRIAEGAFAAVREQLKPGVAERDFALELEFAMRRMGADAPSFDTIVASGPNGARPHHGAGERRIEAGDMVTIDWGARKDGYCSDITRTLVIPGKPVDETLLKIHRIVHEAKERATDACWAGAKGDEVDAVARDFIGDAGYRDDFKHGLGHGLGRDVHDGLTVSQRAAKVVLKAGMVTTIEPGIYIDGLGGVRIEEDVLITADGPVVLTTSAEPL